MNLNKGHALIAVLSICLSFSVGTNIKTGEEHKKIRSKYEDVKGSYDDIFCGPFPFNVLGTPASNVIVTSVSLSGAFSGATPKTSMLS